MSFRKKFAIRLEKLRKDRNLSQNDVAIALNLTRGTVTHWENEERLPSLEVAVRLADYFNVSLDYLVGRSDKHELN